MLRYSKPQHPSLIKAWLACGRVASRAKSRSCGGEGVRERAQGRPGVGKTTSVREIARLLSEEHQRRVVIVDTSNEIGGDGNIPHPGIGGARRMQARWRHKPVLAHLAARGDAASTRCFKALSCVPRAATAYLPGRLLQCVIELCKHGTSGCILCHKHGWPG